jgi:CRISPR-associated protein Csb2
MPTARFATGKQIEATTLVLDTWANVGDGEMQVTWDVALASDQRELLSALVEQMNYLGRSESWTVGRLLPVDETPIRPTMTKHELGMPLDRNEELVTLMAPVATNDYAMWRAERVDKLELPSKAKLSPKQTKELEKAQAAYPADLVEAMHWDTVQWQSFGWTQPPGSQLVQYRRPRNTISATALRPIAVTNRFEPADMMLLSLASGSGSSGLLPSVTRTLPQAELLHKALVQQACADGQVTPEEITGRDGNDRPLVGHQHSHVLPLDLDEDGHLDHVLLWSKMGFSLPAQEAVARLRRTFTKGGEGPVHIALAGRALQARAESWPSGLDRFVGTSRRWVSETPFVAPRFLKKSGANSLEGQIRAELASRGLSEPVSVRFGVMPDGGIGSARLVSRFRHFVRTRARGGKPPPQDAGWYVEIDFAEEVTGPICIGYGSHFGLGVMRGVAGGFFSARR